MVGHHQLGAAGEGCFLRSANYHLYVFSMLPYSREVVIAHLVIQIHGTVMQAQVKHHFDLNGILQQFSEAQN